MSVRLRHWPCPKPRFIRSVTGDPRGCKAAAWIKKRPKCYFTDNRSRPQRGDHKVGRPLTPGFVGCTDDTLRGWPGCHGDVTPPVLADSHSVGQNFCVINCSRGERAGTGWERDNTWSSGVPLGRNVVVIGGVWKSVTAPRCPRSDNHAQAL